MFSCSLASSGIIFDNRLGAMKLFSDVVNCAFWRIIFYSIICFRSARVIGIISSRIYWSVNTDFLSIVITKETHLSRFSWYIFWRCSVSSKSNLNFLAIKRSFSWLMDPISILVLIFLLNSFDYSIVYCFLSLSILSTFYYSTFSVICFWIITNYSLISSSFMLKYWLKRKTKISVQMCNKNNSLSDSTFLWLQNCFNICGKNSSLSN